VVTVHVRETRLVRTRSYIRALYGCRATTHTYVLYLHTRFTVLLYRLIFRCSLLFLPVSLVHYMPYAHFTPTIHHSLPYTFYEKKKKEKKRNLRTHVYDILPPSHSHTLSSVHGLFTGCSSQLTRLFTGSSQLVLIYSPQRRFGCAGSDPTLRKKSAVLVGYGYRYEKALQRTTLRKEKRAHPVALRPSVAAARSLRVLLDCTPFAGCIYPVPHFGAYRGWIACRAYTRGYHTTHTHGSLIGLLPTFCRDCRVRIGFLFCLIHVFYGANFGAVDLALLSSRAYARSVSSRFYTRTHTYAVHCALPPDDRKALPYAFRTHTLPFVYHTPAFVPHRSVPVGFVLSSTPGSCPHHTCVCCYSFYTVAHLLTHTALRYRQLVLDTPHAHGYTHAFAPRYRFWTPFTTLGLFPLFCTLVVRLRFRCHTKLTHGLCYLCWLLYCLLPARNTHAHTALFICGSWITYTHRACAHATTPPTHLYRALRSPLPTAWFGYV